MSESKKYEEMFEKASAQRDTLKQFANSLAELEGAKQIEPKRVLVNGIIRDDELTATFECKACDTTEIMEHFLKTNLDPQIIINGIPTNPFREVRVNVRRG